MTVGGVVGLDRSALMSTYAEPPVTFVRGAGAELWDAGGKRYLDFLCGIAVTSLGHAHPEVAAALSEQARILVHTSNLFGTLPGPEVASTIDRLIGDGIPADGKVFFCNSGSEANECAIKLVRRFATKEDPDRHVIVERAGLVPRPDPGVVERDWPASEAPRDRTDRPGLRPRPLRRPRVARNSLRRHAVAAVILEPIQGEAGVITPSPGYLEGARKICTDRGILLIMDEVQTGLGRTGRWFGFQSSGILPDVVTIAKALGNGMPIGACWATEEVASAFAPGDHGTTFGGQPLASSAAAATLRVMQEIDAPERAAHAGQILKTKLVKIEGVESVRGSGLLIGIQLGGPCAPEVVSEALRLGLVANAPRPDTVRVAPPLVVTDDQIAEGVGLIADAIGAVVQSAAGRGGSDL